MLSSKARKVSSLVQKWQSIKQQDEPFLGSSEEEEEENDPDKQIEEWKKEHLARYRQRVSGFGYRYLYREQMEFRSSQVICDVIAGAWGKKF